MKSFKNLTGAALLSGILAVSSIAFVTGAAEAKAKKATPYALNTCIVTDEKLGEMGKPYVFVHEGQEIKLCCKGCLKDFNKEPAKYVKKLAEARKTGPSKGPACSGCQGH